MAELLTVVCPSCGFTSTTVPAQFAGRTIRCPRCKVQFAAPPASPAGAPPAETVLEAVAATEPEQGVAPTVREDAPPATRLEAGEQGAIAATAPEPPPSGAAAVTVVEKAWSAAQAQEGELLLGLYEVVSVLGQGGMGRVFRVRHRGWGLDLAVKAPLPSVLEATGGADLFEQEAETWVNLGLHPHVVTCHYVRRVEGVPLVFAEYVDGGSLHEALRRGTLDSVESILDVAVQFAWGLHHAHGQGLVHRDVKPANVMLTSDGIAKVTDFGLARARAAAMAAVGGAAGGHTVTVEGGGGGTPAYLSPEQARGESLTRRSDAWSFALCVLEMFLGRRTWNLGIAAPEVMAAFRRDGLRAPGRPPMPAEVAGLIERCLAPLSEQRPHDLAEVAAGLRRAWEQAAGCAYPRPEPRAGAGSADALNNRALSLIDLGRSREAEARWQQALAAEPHHLEATFNSLVAAWSAATLTDVEAVRRMEEARTSHAGSARAHELAARLHLLLGQPAEAAAALARAASLGNPDELASDAALVSRPLPPPLRTLRGLSGPVGAMALSADGLLVVAGSGSEVRAWEAASGRLLRTLSIEGAPVRALLMLPGSTTLVVGAEGAPLAAWDLHGGRSVRSFERQAGSITSLAAVPGREAVVAGGSDRTVRFYEPATGRCARTIPAHDDAVTAVAAGPTMVASASRDGSVRLWSADDGRELGRLGLPAGRPLALAVDEAHARLVVAGDDGVVREFGLPTLQPGRALVSHALPATALAISTDGELLLSGSTDRTVRVFEADGQRLLARGHLDGAVQALALGPDGVVWVAHGASVSVVQPEPPARPLPALCRPSSALEEASREGAFESQLAAARRSYSEGDLKTALQLARSARTVPGRERAPTALSLWDELAARLPRRGLLAAWEDAVIEGAEPLLAVALQGDGQRALTAAHDGAVTLINVTGRARLAELGRHRGAATAVAFASTRLAVSGGRDRTLRLWDLGGRRAPVVLEGHGETVTSVDVTADGSLALSGGADGTVRLWDLRERAVRRVIEGHRAQVSCVRFSPDGQVLVSAGWDGTARLTDAESGALLGVLEGHETNLTALAVHPAALQMATACEDGSIRLFDTLGRRLIRRLDGHGSAVSGLAFTADGRFLLSSGRDASVRAWDLRRGAEIRALNHPAPVLGLALSGSASLLLSAGHDGALRTWTLDWDLDPEGVGTAVSAVAPTSGQPTARATVPRTSRPASLRDDLKRSAPPPVRQALPGAAGVVARHWKKLVAGLAVVMLVAVSAAVWREPVSRLRLSPTVMRSLSGQPDLIAVRSFSACPGPYAEHLARIIAGKPSATDVACVAVAGHPGLVADVLDGAPLSDPDPETATLLRRNAASALSLLEGEAVAGLCLRLSDSREEVRRVAGMALGAIEDAAADRCVRETLTGGVTSGAAAAAQALRFRVGRRFVDAESAWAIVETMARDPQPAIRHEALSLLDLFNQGTATPVAQRLMSDANPVVSEAARDTVARLEGLRRADVLLEGDIDR